MFSYIQFAAEFYQGIFQFIVEYFTRTLFEEYNKNR